MTLPMRAWWRHQGGNAVDQRQWRKRQLARMRLMHGLVRQVRHADFAEAWNNRAQVLLEQGWRHEASQAIAKAVALGGARLPQYQALQLEINKK